MINQFDERSIRRIVRAVLETERRSLTEFPPAVNRRPVYPPSRMMIADQDIEHGSTGSVSILSASDWDSPTWVETGKSIEVYNPSRRVWAGSRAIVVPVAMQNAGIQWCISQAWSATRIRGDAVAEITPGATGTIDTLQPIDGHYGPTTAQVYLPTEFVAVKAALHVWAELVTYEIPPLGGGAPAISSRWEVYSADCESSGGAS